MEYQPDSACNSNPDGDLRGQPRQKATQSCRRKTPNKTPAESAAKLKAYRRAASLPVEANADNAQSRGRSRFSPTSADESPTKQIHCDDSGMTS